MNSSELFDAMKALAIEMCRIDEFGALHIVVSDGNMEDDHIQFCLEQPNITPGEIAFAQKLLDIPEEQRFMAYALTNCPDIFRAATPSSYPQRAE